MDKEKGGILTCNKDGHCMMVDLGIGPDKESVCADMAALCDWIAWDEEIRVVVITFDGNTCFPLAAFVARLKQPVIAAIRGDAIGIGLELAMACDIRIAAENAHFSLPQIKAGQMPSDGGTQRLPRLIGPGKAMEMILTGEPIDAGEAQRMGLIQRYVPSDALLNAAMMMAHEMASKSPLSLRYAKEALHSGMDLTLDQGVKMELDLYLLLFGTHDRVEGITSFREKRKPRYEGI